MTDHYSTLCFTTPILCNIKNAVNVNILLNHSTSKKEKNRKKIASLINLIMVGRQLVTYCTTGFKFNASLLLLLLLLLLLFMICIILYINNKERKRK